MARDGIARPQRSRSDPKKHLIAGIEAERRDFCVEKQE
jgi:hypothetical protein